MTDRLPTIRKTMAPTSNRRGAGTPADAMKLATSLKWGILLPSADSKKIVHSSKRPTTVNGPRIASNMFFLLSPLKKGTVPLAGTKISRKTKPAKGAVPFFNGLLGQVEQQNLGWNGGLNR